MALDTNNASQKFSFFPIYGFEGRILVLIVPVPAIAYLLLLVYAL